MTGTFGLQTCTLALVLAGCAATSGARNTAPSTASPEVSFQVRSQVRNSDEWQPLNTEGVMHSGDHLAVAVQTTAPVYLYVGRAATDRPTALLFPADPEAATLLQPGQTYAVPAAAQGFELDTQVGEENLYLVATQNKLSAAKMKELMATAPAAELGRPRPRPPVSSSGNRDARSAPAAAPPAYVVTSVAPGLFAARFTFQHQQ